MAARNKGTVFRVTGLPASQPDDELKEALNAAINDNLAEDEQWNAAIVPSCYDNEEKVALVEFHGGVPAFLSELMANPLGDWQVEMGDTDISFDQHFFGCTQLYTPNLGSPVTADIIAITGLDGHAYGSWRGKGNLGRMWLRDFLSKDLPCCRTMIYGYNSKLSTHGVDIIMDYSRGLIEELKKVRNTEELRKRPLFFIAHSFGSIILAHCLVKAVQADEDDHPTTASLYRATYGMLLFGIPHKGLVVDDIQKMVLGQDNHLRSALLEQIRSKSDLLAFQLDDFRNLIRDRIVVGFYEMRQTRQLEFDSESRRWRRTGDFVTAVDVDSALLHLPDSIEDKIPLDVDHSMIVKFDNKNSQGYINARDKLRQFEQDAPSVVAARFSRAQNRPKPSSMVPFQRDSPFMGREDILAEIGEKLEQAAPQDHSRVALVGLGGVGKSHIAIEYAYRVRESAPQTWVFWVHASNAARFKQAYTIIAAKIELPGWDDPQADILRLVYNWLCDEQNGRWLIILDNADNDWVFSSTSADSDGIAHGAEAPREAPLKSFLPQSSNGWILVTSRDLVAAVNLVGTRRNVIKVEPMPEEDARMLLRSEENQAHLLSSREARDIWRDRSVSDSAEELGVQVMETRKSKLGWDHSDTLSSMADLALTYWERGRWDKAEELQVHVMITRKRVLGAEHPDTLTSISNLASTYRNQGRWKEAEELEVQVIEMSSSVASDDEDIRSTVETESTLSPLRVAAAWLIAKRFAEDQELFTLYRLASNALEKTRFIRNNRRLLKSYYLGLKAEGQTTPEGKLVVRFLRLRATRTLISSHIYRILMPEILDLEEKAPSTDESEYSINRYLQSIETNNELMVEEPLRNDEFESNSSSDEDEVDDGDDDGVDSATQNVTHAHLQKAAQLLTTGQPFNSYKNSLHGFVFSKFISSPTQTYTEVLEPQNSRQNQGQDSQEIQDVSDQRGGPTTTLVSGNDPADHISWNDSETLFSRPQIAPIKSINKEPHHSEKTFNLMGFLSNLYQSFLLQCLTMAEDIGLYERTLSRGFVRLSWDCTCGCCFSEDYPASRLAAAQHFQVNLIQAGYQARILAWSLEVLDAPVTLQALNDDKEQYIELPKTPPPLQPHQHIVSSTTITPDLQSSASGQTAQGPHSKIHPRTDIDPEQTLGKVEESQSRFIMSSSDQWLLLCFYHNNHVSKAVHMEVGEDPYDDELLLSFKKEYITARGWATYFLSWTAVTDIRFVRFLLIREDKNSSFDYDVEDDLDVGRAKSDLVDLALLQEEWGPPAEWSERHAWAPCPADPRPQPQGKWIMHLWDKPHSSSTWLASKRLQRLYKGKVKLVWTAFNWGKKIKLLWINFRLFRGISGPASVPNSRDDIELQDVVVEIPPLPFIQVRARQQRANSAEKGRFFVNNTPKRLEQRLKADPTTPPYGWGLFFEESLVVPVFFKVSISLVVLLVTIVIVVICAKLAQEKGYQVFGLGGFTLAIASIIVTVIFKFLI